MKYIHYTIISILFLLIPSRSYAVKCPIPNCPPGQLCFCPPPPDTYMVFKIKNNLSQKEIAKVSENRLRKNFALTGIFSFKKRFKPKSHPLSKPLDQISPWYLLKLSFEKKKNIPGISVSLYSRKHPRSSYKKEIWKTFLQIKRVNKRNYLKGIDILSNQVMSKILNRKFSAFGTDMAFVHKISRGRTVIRLAKVNGNMVKLAKKSKIISFSRSLNKEPVFSNDGKHLVFTSHIRYNPDLYIFNQGSSKLLRISARRGMNHAAVFSPDNKFLALTLDISGNPDIYILKTNFSNTKKWKIIKKVTTNHSIDTSPVFSPDGKKLAFVSSRNKKAQIYIKNLTKKRKGARLLFSTSHRTYTPRWCKSGKREYLAFTQLVGNRSVIFIYNMKTHKGWRATSLAAPNAENPSWSPNCNLIAYDLAGRKDLKSGIWISPITGGRATKLFGGSFTMPTWGK